MTRRDFVFITQMFKECKEQAPDNATEHIIDGVVAHFAAGLQEENPRFDRKRFMKAAEVVQFAAAPEVEVEIAYTKGFDDAMLGHEYDPVIVPSGDKEAYTRGYTAGAEMLFAGTMQSRDEKPE